MHNEFSEIRKLVEFESHGVKVVEQIVSFEPIQKIKQNQSN